LLLLKYVQPFTLWLLQ